MSWCSRINSEPSRHGTRRGAGIVVGRGRRAQRFETPLDDSVTGTRSPSLAGVPLALERRCRQRRKCSLVLRERRRNQRDHEEQTVKTLKETPANPRRNPLPRTNPKVQVLSRSVNSNERHPRLSSLPEDRGDLHLAVRETFEEPVGVGLLLRRWDGRGEGEERVDDVLLGEAEAGARGQSELLRSHWEEETRLEGQRNVERVGRGKRGERTNGNRQSSPWRSRLR